MKNPIYSYKTADDPVLFARLRLPETAPRRVIVGA